MAALAEARPWFMALNESVQRDRQKVQIPKEHALKDSRRARQAELEEEDKAGALLALQDAAAAVSASSQKYCVMTDWQKNQGQEAFDSVDRGHCLALGPQPQLAAKAIRAALKL
ncbi:unnamed protein product [Effrenium voratum]|uniref:Uncharacterized protein n=1 Tax=Effrenium voratum TaxID=2562239 RepID=A0AA36MHK6_9DINO|nr:unnamed protein product [Effrenium voratum]CAJ1371746.1 unnamed protein product [Effrenium voratum]